MRRIVIGLPLALGGVPVAFYGLTRLGWRSHRSPATDLHFLHLDWVANTAAPYWRAHVENLLVLSVGLLMITVGLAAVAARTWRARRRDRR